MNLSVWRDVRSRNRGQSGSGDVIVGLRDGNRIWRVSPDNILHFSFSIVAVVPHAVNGLLYSLFSISYLSYLRYILTPICILAAFS